jgi:hypothetical protein
MESDHWKVLIGQYLDLQWVRMWLVKGWKIKLRIFWSDTKIVILNVPMLNAIMLSVIRHDQNPRFSKSLSRLEIFYTRLTAIISCLLTVNTMLPTC